MFDLAKLFINQIDTLQVSGRNEGIGMIGLLPLTILLDCYDSFNVKLKNEWTRYLSVRWNKLNMWQGAVSCATLAAGWNTFSAKTVVFLQKNIISSAGYALASDNCSILLSRLIHLANIRFLWIIDAAEEPEPGAHANRGFRVAN